jgi:transcriptional regulator with XRE-family HTH domain
MSITVVPGYRPTLTQRLALEIKVAMVRHSISGRQLATKLGVSQTWISTRLTGATPIDVNDLERIADAIGVTPVDLLAAAEAITSRYLPGEQVLTTVGEPTPARDGVRRPVKLRRPTGARPSVRPTTPTAA